MGFLFPSAREDSEVTCPCALQSIQSCCWAGGVTTFDRPLMELAARPEFLIPPKYRRLLVRRPHYAVSHSSGCVVSPSAGRAGRVLVNQPHPLFEFRLPPECYTTVPSRPAAARQLLSWAFCSLQHAKIRRSTGRGLYLPATFRLQGLVTLLTACSLQARAGFVSHRRRSWDSPFGASPPARYPKRFHDRCTHLPFLLSLFPTPKRRAGPTGRGSWVSTRSEDPVDPAWV
jgi:hypothetical protein